MAGYVPLFAAYARTFRAGAAVKGGQVVEVTGDRAVGPAGLSSTKVVGVAGFDTAVGDDVTVYGGGVQQVVASAAVAAGDRVGAAADGKVVTAVSNTIGLALTAAAAGKPVQVRFDA